jgi:hypothetical protein
MVDSGNQISNGWQDFYSVYQAMVDASLLRPPKAEIQAYWWRAGNLVQFYVQVKNLSAVTLSSAANSAAVHAIVYEDTHVKLTDRFGRAAAAVDIPDLAPNATAVFTLPGLDLVGVNWDKLGAVVLVDYVPVASSGAFDMLQAAVATRLSAPLTVEPGTLSFTVGPTDPSAPSAAVSVLGPTFMRWTASADAAWITITPATGEMTTQPVLSVRRDMLSPGWQHGNATFTTADGLYSAQVTISAYLGQVNRVYLPVALSWR